MNSGYLVVVVHVVEADDGSAGHLAQQTDDQIGPDESRRTGDEDGFVVEIDLRFCHGSIPPEQIAGIYFLADVVQVGTVAVGDDAAAHFFEFLQIVDDFAAEEGAAVFKRRFIDDDRRTLGFYSFHNTLQSKSKIKLQE